MKRNCFTCRFRYRSLAADQWGGYPWRCSAKGGIKIGSGQDRECPQGLWEQKKEAQNEKQAQHLRRCGYILCLVYTENLGI